MAAASEIAPGGTDPDDPVWPVHDLRQRLREGCARGAGLIAPEESAWAARWQALDDADLLLVARLTGRRATVFRVPDLTAAGVPSVPTRVAALLAEGVLVAVDDPAAQAHAATRAVLAAGCRRAGLSASGRRDALAARMADRPGWDDAPWVAVAAADILCRLERWATFEPFPDRSVPVLERMGRRRWMPYPITPGGLVASRADWDRWERWVTWEAEGTLTVEQALEGLAWTGWPPGRLDRRRALARAVREAALQAARDGDRGQAGRWLAALEGMGWASAETIRLRARWLELDGDRREAWAVLRDGAARDPAWRRALAPAGRRVARAVGGAWVPARPLRAAPVRRMRLVQAVDAIEGPRPGWRAPSHAHATVIEPAVASAIQAAGRTVVQGEGAVWRTVFRLLMLDAWFAPVDGALPVPHLDRPLDWGRPGWASRRRRWLDPVREALEAGAAAPLLASAWDRAEGVRVAGVDTQRFGRETVVAALAALPATAAVAWWDRAVSGEARQWRGLPDLMVLPGFPVAVPGLLPSALPAEGVWVEVKGPGDALRPAQAAWHDRLLGWGLQVETWAVRPAPDRAEAPAHAASEPIRPG